MVAKRADNISRQTVIGVIIASILGVFGLMWYVSDYNRPYRRPRSAPDNKLLPPSYIVKSPTRAMFMGNTATQYIPGVGYQVTPGRVPQNVPRYFANMTTTIGEYWVTVRQVADFDQGITLYTNALASETRFPLSNISFSIQVMAATQEAIDRVKEFVPHLKVTDNSGVTQETTQASEMTRYTQGLARLYYLTPPAEKVTFYKTVEGSLTVTQSDGTDKRVPFVLTNIPLPTENHLFGLAAASLLPLTAQQSHFDADGKGIIQGEPAYAFEDKFPPSIPETGPLKLPNRLILVSNAANHFPIALPTPTGELPLICTLIPHFEAESHDTIRVRLEAVGNAAKPFEWKLDAYENEPLLLTFAPSHFFPEVKGFAAIRLFLFSRPIAETLPTISPFPPEKGSQSGSLVMRAQVGDSRLRSGKAKIEIIRPEGNAFRRGEVTVQLDEQGMGRINNLPPGNYDVVLKELFPFHNNLTHPPDGLQAIGRRYHLIQPQIMGQTQKSLILRPGGQITLQPWRVIESKIAANE